MKSLLSALVLLVFLLTVGTVHAQTPTPTPSPAFVQYDLAFPGMLPDNPLYKFKVLRDKISVVLIRDSLKKIKFYMLQTDKGILAAAMLVDKGKIDLAAQTALKAEHNFTLISEVVGFQPEKIDDATAQLLELAALKHQEVLLSLANRIGGSQRDTFLTVADFSRRNVQTIRELRLSALNPQ